MTTTPFLYRPGPDGAQPHEHALAASLGAAISASDAASPGGGFVLLGEDAARSGTPLPPAPWALLLDRPGGRLLALDPVVLERLERAARAADLVFTHDPAALAEAQMLGARDAAWLGRPAEPSLPEAPAPGSQEVLLVAGVEAERRILRHLARGLPGGPARVLSPGEALSARGGIALVLDEEARYGAELVALANRGLAVVASNRLCAARLLFPELAFDPLTGLDRAARSLAALRANPARRALALERARRVLADRLSPAAVRERFAHALFARGLPVPRGPEQPERRSP